MPIEYAKNMKKVSVSLGTFNLNENKRTQTTTMGGQLGNYRPTNSLPTGTEEIKKDNQE